jgi:anhydro-N-acetylmuramic acid kinase
VVLNIGGFTNLTWLPGRDASGVVAFDPGPGNALLDRAARLASGGTERFDRDGARARRGRVLEPVLRALLADPYFDKPPPKSTGHEHFGEACFERARSLAREAGGGADDLVATLGALTAESVVRAAARFLPGRAERWLVCGGGACNPMLLEGLRRGLAPAVVETTAEHGIPVDALEAIAFALLGHAASRGQPNHIPAATGASRAVVLGAVTPPHAFSRGES